MREFGTRTVVRGACLLAVLAVIAVPLSGLMVTQAPAGSAAGQGNPQATAVLDLASAGEATPEGASAVSSLMTGNVVGLPISSVIDYKHPASAFVP